MPDLDSIVTPGHGDWGTQAWVMEALDAVIAWGRAVQNDLPVGAGAVEVFELSRPILRRLADFGVLALLTPDEDGLVFEPASVDPPEARSRVEAELHHQVEEGTFGWSLFQDRPVIVPGRHVGSVVVLHVMATPARINGVLMATLPHGSESLPDMAQKILSILLWQCAGVVESGQLTAQLEEQNRTLEARVDLRTRELRRSREAALAASQAKSEFLANMSHEIRTPINGIMGMANLLANGGLQGEALEQVRIISRSSDVLLSIVNDVLDTAKVEAGKLELEDAPFDLLVAIEDVLEMLAPRAHAIGVDLAVRFPPSVARDVVGDVGRVKQILTNLVGNAVKFTEEGHVQVLVDHIGGEYHIAVEDTGIGIPPDRLGHMFDKFTQADSSTSRRFGGTGLGLNISRELSRMMGGDIEAESQVGVGSVFRVRLPLEPVDAGGRVPPRTLGRTVLLATPVDTPSTIQLEAIFRDRGVRVVHTRPEGLDARVRAALDGGSEPPSVLIRWGPGAVETVSGLPDAVRFALLCDASSRVEVEEAIRALGRGRVLAAPFRTDAALALVVGDPTEHPSAPDRTPGSTGRVLVAEDDPVNTRVAVAMLERLGHSVRAVTDGAAAIEALEREDFDVVLMDWHMPGMDGFEATQAIRHDGRWPDLPIIALTAGAMAGDRERCLRAGMDDYLTKPIRPERLEETVSRWLARGVDSPAAGASPSPDAKESPEFARTAAIHRIGSESLLFELVDLFLDQWTALREAIEADMTGEDAQNLALHIHRLKGGAANIGAARVLDVAAHLEDLAGDGRVEEVRAGIARLDEAVAGFARVVQDLDSGELVA